MAQEKKSDEYIYIVDLKGKKNINYVISDISYCTSSDRTFDIEFNKLATDKILLNKLNLVWSFCDKPDGARWFASYLSAFSDGKHTDRYNKLLTNPTIRILIEDKKLLEEIKNILKN